VVRAIRRRCSGRPSDENHRCAERRQTCSTRSSDASRVLSAVQPVAAESDDGRPSAVEIRRRLFDAIRPDLHDEDGDATLVIGNGRIGVARREHEWAKAVVEALGGYPQRGRLSRFFIGAPPQ